MEKLKTTLTIFMTIFSTFMAPPTAHAEQNTVVTLHFYVQNIKSGPNATAYTVAAASVTPQSPTNFGQLNVFDEKVTAGPELDSAEFGHLQGIFVFADMRIPAFSQTANLLFTSEKYNGSTITVVGRNQVGDKQREVAVVGGTGAFRFARGYAVTTTYLNDDAENRMLSEYWVHLISADS